MRRAIMKLAGRDEPDHAGLAYDVWAPLDIDGEDGNPPTLEIPTDCRHDWLSKVAGRSTPDGYASAFDRWRTSLNDPFTFTAKVKLASRLLIGHGNPAPTDVGLTLHHTWGVPVIPGSALKGLLAHYLDAAYGEDPAWRGVDYADKGDGRPETPPGDAYRELFGAPDTQRGPERDVSREALQGGVIFHDALWDPGSCEGKPLAPDVLTVHQKDYYNSKGGSLPNDYDSPNPVAFLTVKPGAEFLVAISCADEAWGELAIVQLLKALESWGVGGKTAAGYGRIEAVADKDIRRPMPAATPETTAMLAILGDGEDSALAKLQALRANLPAIVSWPLGQRRLIRSALEDYADNKRTKPILAELRRALDEGVLPPPTPWQAFMDELAALPVSVDSLYADDSLPAYRALAENDRARAREAIREHFGDLPSDDVDDFLRLLDE